MDIHIKKRKIVLMMLVMANCCISGAAAENKWLSSGVGVSLFSSGAKEEVRQYEVYAVAALPWTWQVSGGLSLMTRFNTHAGIVSIEDENAFF